MNALTTWLSRLIGSRLVSTDDHQQMQSAIEQARETLPLFWDWLDEHQATNTERALKVAFDTRSGGVEYIWLTDIRRTAFFVSGLVSNKPESIPGLEEGEICPIEVDKVKDWTFRQGGVFYGHYTTRVLAASNPAMAEAMRDIAPTPLPANTVRH